MIELKCPTCDYEPEENEESFIEIFDSLKKRDPTNGYKSVNLLGCPKCKNVFMK